MDEKANETDSEEVEGGALSKMGDIVGLTLPRFHGVHSIGYYAD